MRFSVASPPYKIGSWPREILCVDEIRSRPDPSGRFPTPSPPHAPTPAHPHTRSCTRIDFNTPRLSSFGKKINSLCIFRSYVCCAKRVQFATYESENDPMIVEQQMLKQQVLLTLTILLDSAGLSLENRSVCLMLLGSLLKIDQ